MKRREQIEAQARRILKYILSLGCSLVLQNSYVSAASITLTVPSSELSVSVDPSKDNGFAKSSDAIVKVSTNGSWLKPIIL